MRKKIFGKWSSIFIVLVLSLALGVLAGCEGDDGKNGRNGVDGQDGQDGAPGLSAYEIAVQNGFIGTEQEWLDSYAPNTDESCNVCHGEDAAFDVAVMHPMLQKPTVSNIVVARSAGDVLTVNFRVTYIDSQGRTQGLAGIGDSDPWTATSESDIRVYMAAIIPAGTVTANVPQSTWTQDYLETWVRETGSAGQITDLGAGNYSFVMHATPADIAPDSPDGLETDMQRVYVRVDARDFEGFDRTMGVADFMMPAAGFDTGVISTTTRTIVDASACTACHGDPLERAAHGGGYQSPQVCNMCHTPIGSYTGDQMQASEWWLASLIHAIHQGGELPGWEADDPPVDFSELTYPKNPIDCSACHFDVGQDMADAWTIAKIYTCTTCHDVTFDGANPTHSGGVQTDATCVICHPQSGPGLGQSVVGAHEVKYLKHNPADGWNGIPNTDPVSITPNYTSTIALSPAAGADGFYSAGDEILVTVTTSNMAAGDYNIVGGTQTANLYVYGPRANPVPVLTTKSTTDPAWDPTTLPTQGHNIKIESTDPQVRTDADGFKYQLLAIPEDLAPGTYMVLAYVTTDVADCSGIYRGNVCIDGWQMTTFQVGTATDEPRVAGPAGAANDSTPGCASCHDQADWGTFYHRSYFGTDGCIACHDQSGNNADPLANRVHAVHAASGSGDLKGIIWDGTGEFEAPTFPRNLYACEACHTSGDESYLGDPTGTFGGWGVPCIGCHGDTDGAKDHMIQSGSDFSTWD